MRRLFLLSIGMMLASTLWAGPVSKDEAKLKALAFLNKKVGTKVGVAKAPRHEQDLSLATSDNAYYVFNIGEGGGFIVVSGSDYAPDIIGYADEGAFDADNLPENLRTWMQGYADQISYLEKTGGKGMRKSLSEWPSVAPLLQTKWDQMAPYNFLCPDFFTLGKSVTGCMATALAQVLFYQNRKEDFPTGTTKEIPAYDCKWNWTGYGKIHVDACPVSKFDWANMQLSYPYAMSKDDVKATAVAKLMQYCGAALNMEYANEANGGSSSSLGKVPYAMNEYFGYDKNVQYRNRYNYSTSEWENIIYQELIAGRPVLYAGQSTGGGHGFVCDGYSENGYFHINWGWSGTANTYFLLSVLNPIEHGAGASSTYDGYSIGQEIVIGFRKPTGKTVEDGPVTMTLMGLDYKGDAEQPKSGYIRIPYHYNYLVNWSYPYTYNSGLGVFDENNNMIHAEVFANANTAETGLKVTGNGTITLPASVFTAGKTYRIKPIIQLSGSSTCQTCLNENEYYIKAVVTTNKVQLATVTPDVHLQVTGMSPTACLPNKLVTVNVAITNSGTSDYSGKLYLFMSGSTGYVAGSDLRVEAGKTETAFFSFKPTGDVSSVKVLKITSDEDGKNVIGTGTIELVSSLTGIDDVIVDNGQEMTDDVWYTLSGVKLEGKPTTKGIFLYQGKKFVIP